MLKRYYFFLALFFTTITIAPELPQLLCNKGAVLSKADRKLFLRWQKEATYKKTPYKVLQHINNLKQNSVIQKSLNSLKNYQQKAIDWQTLEQQKKIFYIFAFGSLINTQSPMNNLCQPNINIPGIAFGIKRIYSMEHPNPSVSCVGLPTHGHEHEDLRLDTEITGKSNNYVNGILLKFIVGTSQYEHLKEREKKYKLVPIKVIDYRSLFSFPRFYDAYILCGSNVDTYTDKKPHIAYNSVVIQGAQNIETQGNSGFVSLLLDTTYLSDGTTSLRSWLIQQ